MASTQLRTSRKNHAKPLIKISSLLAFCVLRRRSRTAKYQNAQTWIAWLSSDLDETVVETEIVPDGVLPSRKSVAVVRKPVDDEVTDAAQRQSLVWRLQNRHCDQRDVRIRRLHQALPARRLGTTSGFRFVSVERRR